jgi:hypothetical protein
MVIGLGRQNGVVVLMEMELLMWNLEKHIGRSARIAIKIAASRRVRRTNQL